LVSVSKSNKELIKELIDGYAIYSLRDELSYYQALRENVIFFEQQLNDRIQNMEFKLIVPFQKKDSNEKPFPYLTTNWPEIDRYKDSNNKSYNYSSEDLINFLKADMPFGFGIKYIDAENIINDEDNLIINIRENHILISANSKKHVSDLIMKREF